ncbi:MAG: AraC family ligand binding domain-containing protein, partial [Burkholderiales bacterium]|nr:AraC family ligand binding domain-containing protein [Burkholderiales bacterium]
MPAATPRIRSYNLFGESAQLPDLMHCETIAARSVRHDWELEPHRHARLHQLLLVESGGGTAHLEGRACALAPMTLVNVPAGDVHGFSFARPTQGLVVTLPDAMREELTAQAGEARAALARSWVLAADEAIAATMRQIAREYAGHDAARALVLRGLSACLLGLCARAAERADPVASQAAVPTLMRRFESALEAHYLEHW